MPFHLRCLDRLFGLLFLPLVAGCSIGLGVPDEAEISCTKNGDCPSGYICLVEAGHCVETDRPDTQGPKVLAVVAKSETELQVTFDEAVSEPSLLSGVFDITPALAVEGVLALGGQAAILTVATQTPGENYTLEVSGIVDLQGNAIAQGDGTASFIGFGIVPDGAPPVLIAPDPFAVVSGQTVDFFWGARLGATTYTLEIGTSGAFDNSQEFAVGNVTSHTVTTLPAESTVYWRVWADTTDPATGQTDPRTGAAVRTFETLGNIVHVYCASGSSCAAPTLPLTLANMESGNLTTPYRSIDRALTAARALGVSEIHVADRGAAEAYAEKFTVQDGVSLRGGYAADFSSRQATPRTLVQSKGTVATASGANASPTLIEGFRIEGVDDASVDYSTALLIVDSDSSLTVTDCDIMGAVAGKRSVGISLVGTAAGSGGGGPLIQNSSVEADRADQAYGIEVFGGAATLQDNTLLVTTTGGDVATGIGGFNANGLLVTQNVITVDGNWINTGIHLNDGSALFTGQQEVVDNTIIITDASQRASGFTYEAGFRTDLTGSNVIKFNGNRVFANAESVDGLALFIISNNVRVEIVNNLIIGGRPAFDTGGIIHRATSFVGAQNVRFSHNTLVGSGCSSCNYMLMELTSVVSTTSNRSISAAPSIVNNLFISQPAGTAYALYEAAELADPRAMYNNAFVSADVVLRTFSSGNLSTTDINSGSLPQVCIGSPYSWDTTCSISASLEDAQGAGNFTSTASLATLFTDSTGMDGIVGTLDDDWTLLTTNPSFTDGGHNTSLSNCGYVGEGLSCGNITVDAVGTSRDTTPSIGAFEK